MGTISHFVLELSSTLIQRMFYFLISNADDWEDRDLLRAPSSMGAAMFNPAETHLSRGECLIKMARGSLHVVGFQL